MIHKTDLSLWATILTLMNADQCSLMLSLKSRMKSTQHFPSEEVAEKVSVDPAPWTLMEDIIWLACAEFQKIIMKNQLLLHWCSCLWWRTWWLTCLTFMPNISLSIHSWRGRQKKKKDKRNTCNQRTREFCLMVFMNACYVPVVSHLAHHTGGIHKTTSVQQCWCKLIDGSSTQEMNILMRDLRNSEEIWS